jgi:hypothetical protein
LAQHHQRVRELTLENGIGLLSCLTTDDPGERLSELLASCGGKGRGGVSGDQIAAARRPLGGT